jgi:hypothetical protein
MAIIVQIQGLQVDQDIAYVLQQQQQKRQQQQQKWQQQVSSRRCGQGRGSN